MPSLRSLNIAANKPAPITNDKTPAAIAAARASAVGKVNSFLTRHKDWAAVYDDPPLIQCPNCNRPFDFATDKMANDPVNIEVDNEVPADESIDKIFLFAGCGIIAGSILLGFWILKLIWNYLH